jgi:hypothetical protein
VGRSMELLNHGMIVHVNCRVKCDKVETSSYAHTHFTISFAEHTHTYTCIWETNFKLMSKVQGMLFGECPLVSIMYCFLPVSPV